MTNDDGKGIVEALRTALLFPANEFLLRASKPLFQHESAKKKKNGNAEISSQWNQAMLRLKYMMTVNE